MAKNLFSVAIFFIVFRECLEAAIIVSVLLGLVEQIVHDDPAQITPDILAHSDNDAAKRRLIKKLRFQIFLGAGIGLFIAVAIGAAFIAVWFTEASDLWAKSENLWEGIFELIACLMIFVMGITMLKMDRAKTKWRIKLQRAFSGQEVDNRTKTGKWVLLILPLITVLREGIEAVVFVGGVSLGQPADSIPIAAIVGLVCGLFCGYLIYQFASRTTLSIFLIAMTNFLLLIGAGLFSKAVWSFQQNAFDNLVGSDVDDTGGNGPGSYQVQGSVWHLDCCNPETDESWGIFNAILGWTNSATVGSVLSYVVYWVCVVVVLVRMKWMEGRMKVGRWESAAGKRRREKMEREASVGAESSGSEAMRSDEKVQIVEERSASVHGVQELPI